MAFKCSPSDNNFHRYYLAQTSLPSSCTYIQLAIVIPQPGCLNGHHTLKNISNMSLFISSPKYLSFPMFTTIKPLWVNFFTHHLPFLTQSICVFLVPSVHQNVCIDLHFHKQSIIKPIYPDRDHDRLFSLLVI